MEKKQITGYCDPISIAPGGSLNFKVSCYEPGIYQADLVKLVCGDTSPEGAGFQEEAIPSSMNGNYLGKTQPINIGSYAVIPPSNPVTQLQSFSMQAMIFPTTPQKGLQNIMGCWSSTSQTGFSMIIAPDGSLGFIYGNRQDGETIVDTRVPLVERQWVFAAVTYNHSTHQLMLHQLPLKNSPGAELLAQEVSLEHQLESGAIHPSTGPFYFAGWLEKTESGKPWMGGHFNGKIDRPRLANKALSLSELTLLREKAIPPQMKENVVGFWDFSQELSSTRIIDCSSHQLHGKTVNLPTRAVTGHNWSNAAQDWKTDPDCYGAIHFHEDDLYDAGWETDFQFTIPQDLKSGIYAAKIQKGLEVDYLTFFVRPPRGKATAPVAFLASTATYMAYANSKVRATAAHFAKMPFQLTPNEQMLADHPEFGLSQYDHHLDYSGVHYSSRLRPMMNMKPSAGLWTFDADTNIIAWLENNGFDYDVITDEDLHQEGSQLLTSYRVIMTGTHPEYYSTPMLDAVDAYLRDGGRFMYLGGNGFYWRIAYHSELPGVIEVRRNEDGTRAWMEESGQYYHSFNGEYGGLWRRLGRPPNQLMGVGFAAQGFDGSSYYRLKPGVRDNPRIAFILEEVEGDIVGDFGRVGGGAAGEEIDRFDVRLGSPQHGVVIASSENHKPDMLRTKEEFLASVQPFKDPKVRADLVFFECPQGGAVFSVGSIAWAGSLAHNQYENNVARITHNVLQRFLDPHPFEIPNS